MKLKSVLVSAALVLASSFASAGTVNLINKPVVDPIHEVKTFTLSSDSWFNAVLKTFAMDGGAGGVVNGNTSISHLALSFGGDVLYSFGTVPGADLFESILLSSSTAPNPFMPSILMTTWEKTYETGALFLKAGEWTMTVDGNVLDNKFFTTMDVSLVPEPQSLALAVAALGALALVSRRRRVGRTST